MTYKKLNPEEKRVIIDKGTEKPFTGRYENHWETGTYVCKRCGYPLYRSDDKFDAGCGWPSFDAEIPDAIKRVPDPDGQRTEIVCSNCGAHLGHVFLGEGFTAKNVRHCVNSISLEFIPSKKQPKKERAYFAGGCFWGVEYYFQKVKGVEMVTAGYMGGHISNPTYEQVCSGVTGHAETVEVVFDPALVSYEELARLFFEIHDPTQINRQGPDKGEQYRSVVFYVSDEQKKTAFKLIKTLEKNGLNIVTEVEKATTFWKAEDYHQDYYQKSGKKPYCHFRSKRF